MQELIKLADLRPSATNPRKRFDDAALQELAKSIEAQGLIAPLVVRRNGGAGFEIVAGERRYRAAKLAKLAEVPCIVRELTDAQMVEIQVVENLQREDVNAIEEADGYTALIEKGGYTRPSKDVKGKGKQVPDTERIAARIGKSRRYVYDRLQLAKSLAPKVREAALAGELPASNAIELARLPARQQEALLAFASGGRESGAPTVKCLREHIERQIHRALKSAPWDVNDAKLEPKAGACAACAKRSDCELFAPVPPISVKSRCLDPVCYKRKGKAFVDRRRKELKDAKERFVLVQTHYETIADAPKGETTMSGYQFSRAKAGSSNGVKALDLSTGKELRVVPNTYAPKEVRTLAREAKSKEKAEPRPLAERRKILEAKRAAWCLTEIQARLGETDGAALRVMHKSAVEMVVSLAAMIGTDNEVQWCSRTESVAKALQKKSLAAAVDALWLHVRPVMLSRLDIQRQEDALHPNRVQEARLVASFVGLKYDVLRKEEAVKACPEPKSWAKEKAAKHTPKSAKSAKEAAIAAAKHTAKSKSKKKARAKKAAKKKTAKKSTKKK